jgi:hypothetical protein
MATKSTTTKKTSAPKASTPSVFASVNGFTAFNKSNIDSGFTAILVVLNGSADITNRVANFVKSSIDTRIDTLPALSTDMNVSDVVSTEAEYVQSVIKGVTTEVKEIAQTAVEIVRSAITPISDRAQEVRTQIAA